LHPKNCSPPILSKTAKTKNVSRFLVQKSIFEIWEKEIENEWGFQFIERFSTSFLIQNLNENGKSVIFVFLISQNYNFLNCNHSVFVEPKKPDQIGFDGFRDNRAIFIDI
jgi:hypothetical protein